MSYGALTATDVDVLEQIMRFHKHRSMKFLEVGIHTGATARGIQDYCATHAIGLEYWGIDNGTQSDCQPPFEGAHMVKGDSVEVFHLVPEDFDVVFIDGNHSGNHVILDTLHYGARVKRGGVMLFHDTSPEIQQTMRDPSGPCIPWFHNSVLAAHKLVGFPTPEWKLFVKRYEPGQKYGGMMAYQKL